MKLIASYSALEQQNRHLQETTDQLRDQLSVTRSEIETLKAQLTGKSTASESRGGIRKQPIRTVNKAKQAIKPQPAPPKSYRWGQRPPFESPSLHVHGELKYKDGMLVDTDIRNAGFMRHTLASANKTVNRSVALEAGVAYTSSELMKYEDDDFAEEPPASYFDEMPNDERSPAEKCAYCQEIAAGRADESDDSLAARSGLDSHEHFFQLPQGNVRLPFGETMDLLEAAYDLVRQGTWEAVRIHWPLDQLREFPEHWKQVRFGCQELESSGFGSVYRPDRLSALCGQTKAKVAMAMYPIIDLRNKVCHANGTTDLQPLDSTLKRAQSLLVLLQDEVRAFAVRRLRDQLRESAEKTFAMIEARGPLAGLPEDEPWPIHVQLMFSQMPEYTLRSGQAERTHGAVAARAAKEWRLTHRLPGDDLPEFKKRLESAQSRPQNIQEDIAIVEKL